MICAVKPVVHNWLVLIDCKEGIASYGIEGTFQQIKERADRGVKERFWRGYLIVKIAEMKASERHIRKWLREQNTHEKLIDTILKEIESIAKSKGVL